MFIKRLNKQFFDVFFQNGWERWARVERNGANLRQVQGTITLDQRTLDTLKGRLHK